MANLMSLGMDWLRRWQSQFLAVPIVYEHILTDDKSALIPSAAVLGRPGGEVDASIAPMRLASDEIDFLIAAHELMLGGKLIVPGRDDRIHLTRGEETQVYELLPQGDNPPWRWSDPQHTIRRIHARFAARIRDPTYQSNPVLESKNG